MLSETKLAKHKELTEGVEKVLSLLFPNHATNKEITQKQAEMLNTLLSQDAIEVIKEKKLLNLSETKSLKDISMHFFGMNSLWKNPRNIAGFFMVHAPEYPTYTIPAYTQAKETGDAKALKKGEGARGLITGALEGVAVGALVSGAKLRVKEMIPYMILGAGLQYFSSKFFPWIAEKAGRVAYNKKMKKLGFNPDVLKKQEAVLMVGGKKYVFTKQSQNNVAVFKGPNGEKRPTQPVNPLLAKVSLNPGMKI